MSEADRRRELRQRRHAAVHAQAAVLHDQAASMHLYAAAFFAEHGAPRKADRERGLASVRHAAPKRTAAS